MMYTITESPELLALAQTTATSLKGRLDLGDCAIQGECNTSEDRLTIRLAPFFNNVRTFVQRLLDAD